MMGMPRFPYKNLSRCQLSKTFHFYKGKDYLDSKGLGFLQK
jgi:hypothetical protein